jgi:peroxiredoxin
MARISRSAAVCTFIVGLQLATLALAQPAMRPATQPAVGQTLSDFKLSRLDGKQIQLSELTKQGPAVVLMLRGWVGYQCPLCTRQVGDFIAHGRELQEAGANVVLLYPGDADLVKAKADEFAMGKNLPANFHFVTDPDLKTVNQWNLRWDAPNETAYPSTFVVGRDGKIVFARISHSHGDRSSAAEVLDVLKNLPTTRPS